MSRHRSGFSLVELLVVISVVALLIALLMPALSKARQTAVRTQCAANLHGLGFIYANYAADNRDWLPQNNFNWGADTIASWEGVNIDCLTVPIRDNLLRNYNAVQKMWDCPNARSLDPNTRTGWLGTSTGTWDAPNTYISLSWIDTGYAIWAGRTQGYRAISSVPGNGLPPAELPQKSSERKLYKTGNTPIPWLNCAQIYRPINGRWSFFDDQNDPQILHYRTGANAVNPDGSVLLKTWDGKINSDPTDDPTKLKFTLSFSVPGVEWKYVY